METASTRTDFRDRLRDELLTRIRANPRYSLRALARSLEIDPSALSKILQGKRALGPRLVRRLGARLGLGPAELQVYLDELRGDELAESDYAPMDDEVFAVIADWYHLAILALTELDAFRADPRWIARVLDLSAHEVDDAVARLQRIGFLEIREDGSWRDRSGGRTSFVRSEVANAAAQHNQAQVLSKAQHALKETPPARRDQTSLTLSIDSSRLPEYRHLIKKFRRELDRLASASEDKDDVYCLSVSLFPLSNTEGESP